MEKPFIFRGKFHFQHKKLIIETYKGEHCSQSSGWETLVFHWTLTSRRKLEEHQPFDNQLRVSKRKKIYSNLKMSKSSQQYLKTYRSKQLEIFLMNACWESLSLSNRSLKKPVKHLRTIIKSLPMLVVTPIFLSILQKAPLKMVQLWKKYFFSWFSKDANCLGLTFYL